MAFPGRSLGGRVPVTDDVSSSHERQIYLTTSLHDNCIECKFRTDSNYYVDLRQIFLVSKSRMVKGHVYASYNPKENKEQHKVESKYGATEDTADEEMELDPLVPLVTHVNKFLHSFFSNE